MKATTTPEQVRRLLPDCKACPTSVRPPREAVIVCTINNGEPATLCVPCALLIGDPGTVVVAEQDAA